MAEISVKSALMMMIICVGLNGFAVGEPGSEGDRTSTVISTLHQLDWSGVRPEDLERRSGISFKRHALKAPDANEACAEIIYLTARDARGGMITMEFDPSLHKGECRLSLYAATFEMTLPHTEAQLERSTFVVQLRPGGTEGCDIETSTYSWRSLDSRVRFDLKIVVRPLVAVVGPSTATKLTVRLTHTNVEPASVDHLPFEKGVFIENR
jgi:hypothetical protein